MMKYDEHGAVVFHRTGRQREGLIRLCIEARRQIGSLYEAVRVADIGACLGESSEIFAAYFDEVYAVDTWAREDYDVVARVTGWDVPFEYMEVSFDNRMLHSRWSDLQSAAGKSRISGAIS
jgi:hypothetical protein